MKNICVFCGSSEGSDPKYMKLAEKIGAYIGKNGHRLVYGGASIGLMGSVADATLENGGEVLGVIPKVITELEIAHTGLTELIEVNNMHERKQKLYSQSDVFLAIPGGFGTMDELFEAITWKQLGIHTVPSVVLNEFGFYDNLLSQTKLMHEEGFISADAIKLINAISNVEELSNYI